MSSLSLTWTLTVLMIWLSFWIYIHCILYDTYTPFLLVTLRDIFSLSYRNLDNFRLNGKTFIWKGNERVDIHSLKKITLQYNKRILNDWSKDFADCILIIISIQCKMYSFCQWDISLKEAPFFGDWSNSVRITQQLQRIVLLALILAAIYLVHVIWCDSFFERIQCQPHV